MAKKRAARGRKAKRLSRAPKMEMLLVGSKTKDALKNHGVNVAGDALDSLNGVVHWYVDQAARRARANGRKTVRGHDFIVLTGPKSPPDLPWPGPSSPPDLPWRSDKDDEPEENEE